MGEEPVAEDHVVLECQARQVSDHKISIKNYSQVTFCTLDLPVHGS